jgi:hypothetical protein
MWIDSNGWLFSRVSVYSGLSLLNQMSLVKSNQFSETLPIVHILVLSCVHRRTPMHFSEFSTILCHSIVLSYQLKLRCAVNGANTTAVLLIHSITNLELCNNTNLNFYICYCFRSDSDLRYTIHSMIAVRYPTSSTSVRIAMFDYEADISSGWTSKGVGYTLVFSHQFWAYHMI